MFRGEGGVPELGPEAIYRADGAGTLSGQEDPPTGVTLLGTSTARM